MYECGADQLIKKEYYHQKKQEVRQVKTRTEKTGKMTSKTKNKTALKIKRTLI